MASKKELKALITLAGKIDPSLQSALMKASKLSSKVSTDAKKSGSALSKVGTIAKGVFVGNVITGAMNKIGTTLLDAGKNGLQLASDLSEVQNVVDTTFGASSNKINEWAQKATESYGLSELQAKQFNGTLGAMLKSSGITGDSLVKMSEKLTGLSGDLASFYNLSQEDAFEKIRSGISGETEPLKQLGINMSVANLNAYALSKGIKTSYDKMDQASQTALRYSYLMSVSKDAQGDFAKTQGSFANQTRLLKTNFEQLSSKIMSKALPALTQVVQFGNDFIKGLNPEQISSSIDVIIDPIKKVGQIVLDVGKIAYQAIQDNKPELDILAEKAGVLGDKLFGAFDEAKPTLEWLAQNGIPAVIDVLTGLINGATEVYDFISNNWSNISPIVYGISAALGAYTIAMEASTIATEAGMIIEELSKAWWVATGIIGAMREGMTLAAIAQDALNFAMEANPIGLVITLIGLAVAAGVALYQNWDSIAAGASKLWEGIKSAFAAGVNWVIDKINSLIEIVNKIPGMDIPLFDKVGGSDSSDSSSSDTSGLDKFATGGIATKPSIFGDDGAEMAIPLKRNPRNLGLLSQAAKILGVGSSTSTEKTVQLNYAPVVYGGNGDEISAVLNKHKEEIRSMIEEILNEGGRVSFG